MTSAKGRQEDDRAYVLHTYPFQDTSVVVEAFTRQHGRIGILAKGARRPKSPLRAALLAFQPLSIAWTGRGELPILVRADWVGRQHVLTGIAMMCGYYLNELLLKLVQRDDPHVDHGLGVRERHGLAAAAFVYGDHRADHHDDAHGALPRERLRGRGV